MPERTRDSNQSISHQELDREDSGLADLAFEVEDNALEIGSVEDLFVFGGTKQESATTEVIDLASDTLGMVVNTSQESITEDSTLASSNA